MAMSLSIARVTRNRTNANFKLHDLEISIFLVFKTVFAHSELQVLTPSVSE